MKASGRRPILPDANSASRRLSIFRPYNFVVVTAVDVTGTMKVFVLLTVFALIGGSQAFLGEIADLFKNLASQLKDVGKDLLHVAEPVATSLLTTLEKAGTQLLTTAAADLLKHLGSGAVGKRDLSETMSHIGQFVTKGEKYIKGLVTAFDGAYKQTLHAIEAEIDHVVNDRKPLEGLMNEIKKLVDGHNEFIDDLVSKAGPDMIKFVEEITHTGTKRDLSSIATALGKGISNLLGGTTNPLKNILSALVTKLESSILGLLG